MTPLLVAVSIVVSTDTYTFFMRSIAQGQVRKIPWASFDDIVVLKIP